MSKQMLVNAAQAGEVRVAIIEDNILEDLNVSFESNEQLRGNIYKARVVSVEPGLSAAFVDYGADRNGFITFNDIHKRFYNKEHTGDGRPRIQDVIKVGAEMMVQVHKEEIGNKGAALTSDLTLPGRYLVLMPHSGSGGVSRKISDEATRKRLKALIAKLNPPDDTGIIVRTAGQGRTQVELQKDYQEQIRLWGHIQAGYATRRNPGVIYREPNVVIRSVRDYYNDAIDEVIVDDAAVHAQVVEFFEKHIADDLDKVTHYTGKMPIFSNYGLERQLENIANAKVPLPSGGSIVLNPTEALMSIDVNSGKSRGQSTQDQMAYGTNKEAAIEVARQLRLRDVGGLIVVDFIDMNDMKHRRDIEGVLKKAMKRDKARVEIGRVSRFGLLEMSRQRIKGRLLSSTHDVCPMCEGSGYVMSTETSAMSMLRRLQELAVSTPRGAKIRGRLPVQVALCLLNIHRTALAELEERFEVVIELIPDLNAITARDAFEVVTGNEQKADSTRNRGRDRNERSDRGNRGRDRNDRNERGGRGRRPQKDRPAKVDAPAPAQPPKADDDTPFEPPRIVGFIPADKLATADLGPDEAAELIEGAKAGAGAVADVAADAPVGADLKTAAELSEPEEEDGQRRRRRRRRRGRGRGRDEQQTQGDATDEAKTSDDATDDAKAPADATDTAETSAEAPSRTSDDADESQGRRRRRRGRGRRNQNDERSDSQRTERTDGQRTDGQPVLTEGEPTEAVAKSPSRRAADRLRRKLKGDAEPVRTEAAAEGQTQAAVEAPSEDDAAARREAARERLRARRGRRGRGRRPEPAAEAKADAPNQPAAEAKADAPVEAAPEAQAAPSSHRERLRRKLKGGAPAERTAPEQAAVAEAPVADAPVAKVDDERPAPRRSGRRTADRLRQKLMAEASTTEAPVRASVADKTVDEAPEPTPAARPEAKPSRSRSTAADRLRKKLADEAATSTPAVEDAPKAAKTPQPRRKANDRLREKLLAKAAPAVDDAAAAEEAEAAEAAAIAEAKAIADAAAVEATLAQAAAPAETKGASRRAADRLRKKLLASTDAAPEDKAAAPEAAAALTDAPVEKPTRARRTRKAKPKAAAAKATAAKATAADDAPTEEKPKRARRTRKAKPKAAAPEAIAVDDAVASDAVAEEKPTRARRTRKAKPKAAAAKATAAKATAPEVTAAEDAPSEEKPKRARRTRKAKPKAAAPKPAAADDAVADAAGAEEKPTRARRTRKAKPKAAAPKATAAKATAPEVTAAEDAPSEEKPKRARRTRKAKPKAAAPKATAADDAATAEKPARARRTRKAKPKAAEPDA